MLYLGPMDKILALNAAIRRRNTADSSVRDTEFVRQAWEEAIVWGAEPPPRYRYSGCVAAPRAPGRVGGAGEGDVLVLPEVWTQYLEVLIGVQKVVWWLSVDNNGGSFKAFLQTAAEGVVHVSNSQYGVCVCVCVCACVCVCVCVMYHTSYIMHHTSNIIHHTSYITHHTSHIIYHISYITHHTSYMHI